MRLIPRRVFGCSLLLLFACLTSLVQAASPITGSGLNTQVSPPVPLPSGQTQFNITGGTRPGGASGTNLFHSFGDFNVPNNNIANFLNNSGLATSNILGRVTGGNLSSILGTIQTTGFGNANLFLMNPAGFLFGPNATVNVGGMVSFTSADYLRLADGARFNAIPNTTADALLSAAPVAAFGFLGSNPGAITVQGSQLTVTEGTGISLVGGNITVQSGTLDDGTVQPAKLTAPGGQINLASVASPGEILLSTLQSAPNINGQSFTAMGNISLSEGALLDVSADAAGTVRIRGGQLLIAEGTISADTVNTNGAPTAVDIQLTGNLSIANDLSPAITARTTGSGDAGQVSIESSNMTASSNTEGFVTLIDTHTSGSGKAGDVNITTGNLQAPSSPFFGFIIFSDTGTEASGHGGDLTINAKNVNMQQWSSTGNFLANAFGLDATGSAGNVNISTDSLNLAFVQITTDTFSFASGTGQAGNINVTAHDINLSNSTFSAAGHQRAGLITINTDQLLATNSQFISQGNLTSGGGVTVNGRVIELSAGSSLASSTGGDGNAGPIIVTATDHLTLSKDSKSDRPSGIFSNSFGTFGSGNAGDITITTPTLVMDGGARINTITASSGHGGNVTINTTGPISMSGESEGFFPPEPLFDLGSIQGSGIYTRTIGGNCSGPCGDAGSISIRTGSLSLGSGAQINSGTSTTGHGGNITIHASATISLSGTLSDGSPAGVFSRTTGTDPGSGNGGNIALHAAQFQVTNSAHISASTLGSGNAGNIAIQGAASPAQSVLIDGANSGVFTDTQGTGAGGNIFVDANSVTLQNGGVLSAATTGTAPSATGGSITVNGQQVALNSQALITADTNGIAPAGVVEINTGSLAVNGGSQIRSSSGAEESLAASLTAAPTLTGGTITIDGRTGTGSQADSVSIDGTGSGIFTQSTGNRPGGDINIAASGSVTMTNGASISASSTGTGNAGNIQINAGNQLAMTNSTVTTEANQASGGAIKITTGPSGTVELTDSTISASVLDGTGGGGSVNIDPQSVVLINSQILANAIFGPGGNINITTNLLLPDSTSVISASSQFGQQGTIIIQSPISPASGKIVPLGQKPLLATTLLSQRCAALAGGNASSFTVAGRDALPVDPGGWLSSPLALTTGELVGSTATEPEMRTTRSMEEMPVVSLRRIAPPGFLIESFATDWSAGCAS